MQDKPIISQPAFKNTMSFIATIQLDLSDILCIIQPIDENMVSTANTFLKGVKYLVVKIKMNQGIVITIISSCINSMPTLKPNTLKSKSTLPSYKFWSVSEKAKP